MAESKQRSRFLLRVQLSDDLSDQLDEALEIAKIRTILKPVEATLGNPIAFPIIFGLGSVFVGFLILRHLFPLPIPSFELTPEEIARDLLAGIDRTIAPVRNEVEKVAEEIADVIHRPLPDIPGVVNLEEARQTLVRGTRDLLMRLWDGIQKLPPVL